MPKRFHILRVGHRDLQKGSKFEFLRQAVSDATWGFFTVYPEQASDEDYRKWLATGDARDDLNAALDFVESYCAKRLNGTSLFPFSDTRAGQSFVRALDLDGDAAPPPFLTYAAPSGLTLTESQLLAAQTLLQLERTATAAVADDVLLTGSFLWDVHCLFEAMWISIDAELELVNGSALTRLARKAAISRYQNDPKQLAKRFVYECWEAWQQRPDQYRSAAAFARAMLDKQPDTLMSSAVIERWVRAWAKVAK